MVTVREMTMKEWQLLRDTRLEALQDAPDAFGSTYDEETVLAEEDWQHTISRGGTFLAYISGAEETEPAGVVCGLQERPGTVELTHMWVRPQTRGDGVGEALVAAVVDWAIARNAASVHLWVFETNVYARTLYERCGFSLTNESQPLPTKPGFIEIGMVYPL
jgi:GNAT superfamily N-acetyltransferase